jgi:hypothetical protein
LTTGRSTTSPRAQLLRLRGGFDCYNESAQLTGWFTIEENLAVPFETTVLGVTVTVERVALCGDLPVATRL